MTKRQKLFHYIGNPVLAFIGFYFFMSIIGFLFKDESLMSLDSERVLLALASAIGVSIVKWIGSWVESISPPKERSDSKKTLKEYINQYVTKGSSFNKLMIIIYTLAIISVVLVISLYIIGYL